MRWASRSRERAARRRRPSARRSRASSRELNDLAGLVGADNLGEQTIFEPTEYGIAAPVVDDLSVYGSDGIEPTVVDWPTDASVRLAEATICSVVPASEVGEVLTAANQLTFFTDDGVTYQVLAKPILPGTDC